MAIWSEKIGAATGQTFAEFEDRSRRQELNNYLDSEEAVEDYEYTDVLRVMQRHKEKTQEAIARWKDMDNGEIKHYVMRVYPQSEDRLRSWLKQGWRVIFANKVETADGTYIEYILEFGKR